MATAEKRVVTDATGQAILAELRKIPGVMNPVPIEKGGTGASTPEEAREAIRAQEKLGFNVSEELNKRIKSVNEILPDENGNVQIIRVPMADNFTSDESHIVSGTFIERTTGGDTSITDGNAYLGVLYGNSVRSGYTAETKNFETRLAERTDDSQPMTAEINWNTFREAVGGISTNKTFSYTTTWNENPETYGIVVGGTPKNGDVINVYFIAENRGVIANATPETFNSANWNLYDNETGYAKVLKYSDVHGFKIGGTYTGVSFSATVDGEKTVITPDSNGLFTIPSDGYVFVTGGNDTDTYVLMTWSDWEDGYTGDFMTKNVSTIDFSELMQNVFPFGLCAIGIVTDEINFNDRVATVRIERVAYSTENRIIAENSGRDYIYDANWIYSIKETPEKVRFNIDNDLVVYDHGVEYFTGTEVSLTAFELFGQNLKDKLRREVVAVTPQNFSASQKQIARENIEAAWNSEVIKSINNKVPDANGNITIVEGQSNASYGSYRIDPVIPPAAWSLVNGQYQVAYSDPLIKSTMTGSETWLDNNDAMLGKTTFNTIDGALLIVTAVQPTETWRLHVLLAENGATVLEDVNNKVDESDLAIVETEDTAFHNITAGQYVMWKGKMYKATTAIASGATLSATGTGANLAAVSNGVANELNSDISQFMHVPTETYDGDLNSLRTPGWYLIGTNATNTPPQINSGKLKVEESSTSNYTRQTFYCGYTYHIYTRSRYYYNNDWRWTSWQEVTNESINNNIANYNFGSKTLEQFQSELVTYAGSMGYRTYKHISVEISVQSGLFVATTYVGTLEKLSSDTRFIVTLRNAYEVAPGDIEMTYKDGTWTISSLNHNINKKAYESSSNVIDSNLVTVIKGLIANGSTSGIFLASKCTNTPDATKYYKIRYTKVDGSDWVLLEAWNTADVSLYYINEFNRSSENIGTWKLYALNSSIGKLNGSTAYTSGVDANSYTTSGVYHVGITSNSPTGATDYGILEVEAVAGDRITQRFTNGSGIVYSRQRYNASQWSSWNELALKSDINDMVKIKSLGIGGNQTIANIKNVCANASFTGMTTDYLYMNDSEVTGWSLVTCSVKTASAARVTIWILNPSKIITIDTGNLTDWTQKTVNLS